MLEKLGALQCASSFTTSTYQNMGIYEEPSAATNLALALNDGQAAEDDGSDVMTEADGGYGFRIIGKALELPLVAGISGSVVATTEYITSTRPVVKVAEKIVTVGERNDVKYVLNSMQSMYDNNLASRVEDLKTSINPTLKNLDDYACTGLDKVNDKVAETKEAYVDPMVEKVTSTKEAYVDPAVEKVTDLKDKTSQIVTGCMETAASVGTNYISPAIGAAAGVKNDYVVPALSKAYAATEDPGKAYSEVVVYGKQVLITTKDDAFSKAMSTVDSAKQYFVSATDATVDKVVGEKTH